MQEISKEAIKDLIGHENPIILDIGSYDGKDSEELSKLFTGAEIHCFEADPRSQELWKQFHSRNRKMTLYNTAIGNVDGPIYLNQSDSNVRRHYEGKEWSASSSILPAKNHLELFPDVRFEKTCRVMCFKLDSWTSVVLKGREEKIDFIWCDVNGAEKEVIEGALKTLAKTRFLYIEFSDKELYEGQICKEELLGMIPDFEEIGVYNFQGNFGNVLLKNKNYGG